MNELAKVQEFAVCVWQDKPYGYSLEPRSSCLERLVSRLTIDDFSPFSYSRVLVFIYFLFSLVFFSPRLFLGLQLPSSSVRLIFPFFFFSPFRSSFLSLSFLTEISKYTCLRIKKKKKRKIKEKIEN